MNCGRIEIPTFHIFILLDVCFILNTKDHLGKFDSKAQKCFLLGYYERSKGYRVYNTETLIVEESINIRFDDKLGLEKPKQFENFADIDIDISEVVEPRSKVAEAGSLRSNGSEDQVAASLENLRISEEPTVRRSPRLASAHSEDVILGKKDDPIRTRAFLKNNAECQLGLVSLIEPTSVDQALEDPDWIIAMQEELNHFTRNDVWDLVPRPKGFNIIGTKWVFRKKLSEKGEVVRNKARLVAQGYSQQEGIDYT